jgi:hypothetical protein
VGPTGRNSHLATLLGLKKSVMRGSVGLNWDSVDLRNVVPASLLPSKSCIGSFLFLKRLLLGLTKKECHTGEY